MSGHIVVVGSINMDLVVRTARHPEPGETVLGEGFRTYPGGKGANQAVAAARAGGRVNIIGCLGRDTFGDRLEQELTANGVNTSAILRTDQAASGVALITLDAQGQNTIVVAAGANSLLAPQDIKEFSPIFDGASALVVQLETPLPTVTHAVAMAKLFGVKVILNPAPAQPLPGSLLANVDYLIPNEKELGLLTGIQMTGLATEALQSLGAGAVVVTLGDAGVYIAQGPRHSNVPAYSVPVVDTVAAGDAFVGAFAVAISEGKSVQEAAEWGNAAGALAITRAGAQPSLPTREEIEEFLRKQPRAQK